MVNVVGMPGNKSAAEGETVNGIPAMNFTVTFAVTAALTASLTVKSIGVSAVTAFAVTVNVLPVTLVVTGNILLLLENTA